MLQWVSKFDDIVRIFIFFHNELDLVAWLGPGSVSADGYITVLKVQMDICKGGRRIKIGSF